MNKFGRRNRKEREYTHHDGGGGWALYALEASNLACRLFLNKYRPNTQSNRVSPFCGIEGSPPIFFCRTCRINKYEVQHYFLGAEAILPFYHVKLGRRSLQRAWLASNGDKSVEGGGCLDPTWACFSFTCTWKYTRPT